MKVRNCAGDFVSLNFVVFDELSPLSTIAQSFDLFLIFLCLLLEALELRIILKSNRTPCVLRSNFTLCLNDD